MEITDVNTLFGAYPSRHPDSTAESLVAAMDGHGVQWCLTLSTWGLFHRDAVGNAETLRACRTHDHLIPVATLNPIGYWGQTGLIEGLAAEPFEMFRFFPHAQGWPLDFAPFSQLLAVLASLPRMPIMVSVEKPGDATQLARLVAEYPHPVILDGVHGGTIPESIAVMRTNDHLYVETHAMHIPDGLVILRDAVGIHRVLFGSDAPGMALGAALRYVKSSALSDDDQRAVLSTNAQQIWQTGGEE